MPSERGQATVELALCLPFVALLVAALVQIGLIVADQGRLWHAAREAARAAVVDSDPAAAREAAASSGLQNLELTIQPSPHDRLAGKPLTVILHYRPEGRVPIVGSLFRRLELEAKATMRIEQT
ncbi:MAG: TadE family protein [Actinomycetota bacterium]